MNNVVFGKTMEDVRKYRNIKLVTTNKRKNQLALEPNYHTPKYFPKNLMAIEMKKTKVKMHKSIYLDTLILDIIKHLCMNFGMSILNQSINAVTPETEQNYAIWILTSLSFTLKPKIFIKTLLMMLKNGLTHETTAKMTIDRFSQVGMKKKSVFLNMNQEEGLRKNLFDLEQKHIHT